MMHHIRNSALIASVCTDIGAACCAGLSCEEGLVLGGSIAGPDGGLLDASGGNSPKRCQ